jgi:hypothetical protein
MTLDPVLMFHAPHCTLYASWDSATGMPLTTLDNEPLSKSSSKKAKKEWDKQKKVFEANKK